MKTVTLKLPEVVDLKITSLAQKRGVTRSEIVREALAEYIARGPEEKTGSMLDLTKDIIGTVDGPSDLSTNKSHMENYGQ